MIDLYFECTPEFYNNVLYESILIPDNDILPLDILQNSFSLYQDGIKVILKCRMSEATLTSIYNQLGGIDPLSMEAVEQLDIKLKYIGNKLNNVFNRYPELNGIITVTTEDCVSESTILNDVLIL